MATPPPDPTRAVAARSSVTPVRLIIALVGLCLLVAAAVVWAFFGRAPETVKGNGIIVPSGGYTELGTESRGVIKHVWVVPGDTVRAGQPVVEVERRNRVETVSSKTAGVVVDVTARPGRPTGIGEPLVVIDPTARRLVTTAFLPAASADLVLPGMSALVSPSDAPRSQYGFIEGRVASVAPAPVSKSRVMTLLGDNEELAEYFLTNGPVGEITVEMFTAETASGYAWTIGFGPEAAIGAGTLADVQVVLSDGSVVDRIVP